MGLRLSPEKTLITHIDEGLDFLGWRIQRHRKRGTNRYYVYTYPARKAVKAVMGKVKTLCRRMDTNQPLDVLLRQLNRMLQGWCAYFRPGVSSRHLRLPEPLHVASGHRMAASQTPPDPPGRTSAAATATADGGRPRRNRQLFNPAKVAHHALPLPGNSHPHSLAEPRDEDHTQAQTGLVERPVPGNGHAGCGKRPGETDRSKDRNRAPGRLHRPRQRPDG